SEDSVEGAFNGDRSTWRKTPRAVFAPPFAPARASAGSHTWTHGREERRAFAVPGVGRRDGRGPPRAPGWPVLGEEGRRRVVDPQGRVRAVRRPPRHRAARVPRGGRPG